jgi:hypothetical protein
MNSLLKTFSKKISGKRKTINNYPETNDLNKVSPQDLDPRTLKPITEIVLQSDKFIVTIDNSLSINWMTNDKYHDYAKDFSVVTSRVQLLSVQINQLFASKANRYKYKKIVAEALGLVLDEKKSDNAIALLKDVEGRIKEYGKERVRIAYIFYAFFTTCLIGLLLWLFVQNKNSSWLFAGNISRYQVSIATLMGGIGAFVSTFIRFKNYEGNIISGLSVHRLDGFLRVLYGCIAGLILALAIYSNTIFGFLNNAAGSQSWVIYFLATIAGASEFLVPNIVRNTGAVRNTVMKSVFKEKKEDDSNKKKVTEKPVMIYEDKRDGDDNKTVYEQNEGINKMNKMQEEIKITGQVVQGKINLQDY